MKSVKITPPEGYEIDKDKSSFEEIVFKKIEKKMITSWEELEVISGRVISNSKLLIVNNVFTKLEAKNIYPTKEQAEAGLLLPQLLQVRDYLRDGWTPSKGEKSWRINAELQVWKGKNLNGLGITIFSFPTQELAEHFAKHFGDRLIDFYTKLQ